MTKAVNKRAVLVIDDSQLARAAIAQLLSKSGYVVHELPSAIGSTKEILRHNVGAVIVDLDMPGLRGDKLVSLLRSNVRLNGVALILLSGQPQAELDKLQGQVAVDALVVKHDLPMLGMVLSRVLTQRT